MARRALKKRTCMISSTKVLKMYRKYLNLCPFCHIYSIYDQCIVSNISSYLINLCPFVVNFEQFSQQTSRLVLAIGTLMVFVVFRSKTFTNSPKRPSLHKITLDMFDSLCGLRDSRSFGWCNRTQRAFSLVGSPTLSFLWLWRQRISSSHFQKGFCSPILTITHLY